MNNSIYAYTVSDITNAPFDFAQLKGKVVLIVNSASKCAFTQQYAELEQLYQKYKRQGLEIIAFPCDQFGYQEPGSSADIQQFCQLNYQLSFLLMNKIKVNGKNSHPLYQFLKLQAPGIGGTKAIKWNFTKFLVNRDGSIITRYPPYLKPFRLEYGIQSLLQAS